MYDLSSRALPGQGSLIVQHPKVSLRAKINELINNIGPDRDPVAAFSTNIWPKLEADYQKMAEELATSCKKHLNDHSIPAMVESRVKTRHSIAKSLERREQHRLEEGKGPYRNIHDILHDIHDLTGIRIVVDYPHDLEEISSFVTQTFCPEKEPNIFSANRQVGQSWRPWFGAYECENHHLTARYCDDDPRCVYNNVMFEIQVTSLPMTLYNNISHSLLYKKEAGPLSRGDEIMIDLTKGLAICYSLCLYYKSSKLEDHQIQLMRQASAISEDGNSDLNLNNLVGILPTIPGLDGLDGPDKRIPRETFQMVLDNLPVNSETQTADKIWKSLLDKLSREIEEIGYSPIKLPTAGRARFDSDDVYTSPRCQEGTQAAARQYIYDWINNKGETTLLWIHSPAGTGKSTLARTVADDMAEAGQIAAGYFFKRGDMDRNHESRIFPTIASQLISTIPHYKSLLRKSLQESHNTDISSMPLEQQFRVLIEIPLSEIDPLTSTKVIIIDALDECINPDRTAEIIGLLHRLEKLKTVRFRLLVTSRDEVLVRVAVEGHVHNSLSLASDFRNDNISDIEMILKSGFARIQRQAKIENTWPTDEQFQEIVQQATDPSPLFIYAATLLRFLHDGTRRSFPKRRLESWMSRCPGAATTTQLDEMYTTVLENLDRDMLTGKSGYLTDRDKDELRKVLGAVVLAAEPLSAKALINILGLDPDMTHWLLESCRAVIEVPKDDDEPVEMVHKSFADFILKKYTFETRWFHVDEVELHEYVTKGCIKYLRRNLQKDICKIGDPGITRVDIEADIIKRHISTSLQYASSHWSHHLLMSKEQTSFSDSLLSLLDNHFLHWLECLSILGQLTYASTAINGAYAVMKRLSQPVDTLVEFLKDARRFVLRHGSIIQESPLQIYGSALLFSPAQSIIRQKFWNSRHSGVEVIRSIEQYWDARIKVFPFDSKVDLVSIALSPDGQKLALAQHMDTTYTISVRHTGAGTRLAEFVIDSQPRALTWDQDGDTILSISHGKISVHDPTRETTSVVGYSPYSTDEGYDFSEISSSGTASVVRSGEELDYYGPDSKSQVNSWNFRTGEIFPVLEFSEFVIRTTALSLDGSLIAIALEPFDWGCDRDMVKLIHVRTGSCVHNILGMARTLAFSPDGSHLFSSDSPILTILTIETMECESKRMPDDFKDSLMAILPEGNTIITATSQHVEFWDIETLSETFDPPRQSTLDSIENSSSVEKVAISLSGRLMVTTASDCLHLWRLPEGTVDKTLYFHLNVDVSDFDIDDEPLTDELWNDYLTFNFFTNGESWDDSARIGFSDDEESFVVSFKEFLYIWMLGPTEDTRTMVPCTFKLSTSQLYSNSLSHDHQTTEYISLSIGASVGNGGVVAVGSYDAVEVWKLGHVNERLLEFKAPKQQHVNHAALSNNSTYLAIAYGTTVKVYVFGETIQVHDLEAQEEVLVMFFSPDDSTLAFASYHGIWTWATMSSNNPTCLFHLESFFFSGMPSFSPDGNLIASIGWSGSDSDPTYSILLWKTSNGFRLPDITLVNGWDCNLSFSTDGKWVHSSDEKSILESYQVEPNIPEATSAGHIGLDSGWVYRNGQRLLEIPQEYSPSCIAFSSNYLAIVDKERKLLVLDLH